MIDKIQSAIDKGQRAKNILDDQTFADAKAHIDAELYRLFSEARPTDTEALTFVKDMHYLHTKYLAFLNRAVQDGKMAQIEVERESKLRTALRKVVG